ncbi:trypsin-like serine protease, partial [Romeria aff. gracilis LEGE 07310]
MKFYGKQAAVLLLSLSLGAIALRSWQAANAVSLDDLLPQLAAGTSRSLDELTPETSSRPESLNQTDNPSGDRAVIGRDDRIPVLSNAYPWSAIGQVVSEVTEDAYSTCTGTLITRDVILTNAHCVVSPETGEFVRRVAFLPNLINGRIASEFDVAYGVEVLAGTDFRDAPT